MNTDLTDITVLLDRSGSMSSVRRDVIEGINKFIQGQRTTPGKANLTLIQFNHEYEPNYIAKDVQAAPFLSTESYEPRGNTRLNDSLARAIDETGQRLAAMPEAERPGKVIFVVQTDGFENASQVYPGKEGRDRVRAIIQHQSDKYSWQFIFLGANMNAVEVGQSYGFQAGKSFTYAARADGTSKAYLSASSITSGLRCALSKVEMDSLSFSAEDKKAQEELLK